MSTILMDKGSVDNDVSDEEKYRRLLSENAKEYNAWLDLVSRKRNASKEELDEIEEIINSLEAKRNQLSKLYLSSLNKK
jgi:hypothetical protein